jgi:glutathione synthase
LQSPGALEKRRLQPEKYPMSVRLGIVMDPIAQIAFKKDSSLAMLLAAQARGWSLFYMEQKDLYQSKGQARARMSPLTVHHNPEHWFDLEAEQDLPLQELDVILMRKDPPFDNEFVYSTYLLEQAEEAGVLVVNRPQSLRDCNEKFFATRFPQFTPPTVVSRRADILREFAREHRDIILKPLDGMGGSMIFRHREGDPNLSVILEALTEHGSQQIMAQGYLPGIKDGDKRILMIDGEPVPYCLARIPAAGETRGNLAAGGRGEARPLSARDREIAEAIGPSLRERGLLFVGLDVIGEHLTEINVTSPTCIREIDAAYDTRIGERLMDCIAEKLAARSAS